MFHRIVVSYPASNRWLISVKRCWNCWAVLLAVSLQSQWKVNEKMEFTSGIYLWWFVDYLEIFYDAIDFDFGWDLRIYKIIFFNCSTFYSANWFYFFPGPPSVSSLFPWVPVHFKTTWLTLVIPGNTLTFPNFQNFNIFGLICYTEPWFVPATSPAGESDRISFNSWDT